MSTPIRNEDGAADPLLYFPRRARRSPPVVPELSSHGPATAPEVADASAAAPSFIDAPSMAPGIGGPNIELPPPRSAPFAGDVAIKDLRRRLSLDPDLLPQPPLQTPREFVLPWIGR